ncbi:TonB-dependent receptor plug domain-containing protein [Labilibaculum antarcticum]|uniref:Peptidase M56 domain-containing protein n=1 Tax=Labilibaculum antarcticum TaxID=1717717 RepID=A0A1Y1CP15_9BACT|nr:TonB-dependent receptor plug domain-containing protein [Labilibaculum antarcticum]BAX82004.1 hypothetical protein ALGA_3712 [Labilibaculum antarcticum]
MELINNFDLYELSHTIGWTLVHSLWQAMVIGGLIWLLFRFISKDNARIRYAFSGLGLILICVASAITFYRYIPSNTSIAVSDIAAQIKTIGFVQQEESFFARLWIQLQAQLENTFPYLVNIWMIGMLFLSINLILKYIQTLKLKKHLTYPLRSKYMAIANRLVLKYNLKQNILFKESGLLDIPSVIGYFKPIVLLPVSMLSGIPENQLEIIIAHELAHIRRHDYLLQFIQGIIELVFFYHPVVWWLSSVVNAEREHICDDLAVTVCGESLPLIKALNNMEAIRKKQYEMVLGFSGKKGKVLNRIKRILRPKASTNPRRERFMLSGVFTLLFAGLFLISNFAISGNTDSQKAFYSKINILDKTTNQAEKSIQMEALPIDLVNANSKNDQKKKNKNQTEVVAAETELEEVTEVEEAAEVEEMELLEMPPMPPLPAALDMPFNSFDAPEFNFPKDSVKSDKWVKMKADEIIKEQLKEMKSAEREMKDMKIDLDVDQMRKELQEGLKDLDFNSVDFQDEMKEQQIEIDKQLKELTDGNFAKKQELQKMELENHLKEIELTTELNKKEKDQLKSELKETVERMNSKEFQDQLKKQLEDAKESLKQHKAKFESGEFENRMKEQRENIEQELKKIESPEFQEKINRQIKESKTRIQEHIQKVNSDEYRHELEESIRKSPETRKGLPQSHSSISDPDKQPLIILDGEKITRTQMEQISPNEIESISVLKDASASKLYGKEAKNGVIVITSKSNDQKKNSTSKLNLGDLNNSPLYFLDGEKIYREEMDQIKPESIESMNVIKGEQAIKKYGKKGTNGVIEITSKIQSSKNAPVVKIKGASINNPLYIVDGKKISAKKANKINPDDIESMDVLKGENAIKKYGEEAKNGVIVITLKTKFSSINSSVKFLGNTNKDEPLYIINGEKISAEEMNKIDANNIDYITVLKDEKATNQYGKEAKNGAVVIRLKE